MVISLLFNTEYEHKALPTKITICSVIRKSVVLAEDVNIFCCCRTACRGYNVVIVILLLELKLHDNTNSDDVCTV